MHLTLGYLYPDLMNIYGDQGNVIALQKRCQWRSVDFEIKKISINEPTEELKKCDLFFFGGGQDKQQVLVAEDLQKNNEILRSAQNNKLSKGEILKKMLNQGTPLLSICGGFQLLGKSYHFKGKTLPGIFFFDAETRAGKTRFINNILTEIKITGGKETLVGFENHSGRTYLFDKTKTLGRVISGHGNNGEDKSEGAVKNNAIGTYLHGSLLPKNPHLADWLIKKALEKKYGKKIQLPPLDDKLEWQAHQAAVKSLF
jgi:CobQ-like glutamine amidotransferase family enzyme